MELSLGLLIGKKIIGEVQIKKVKNKELWILLDQATENLQIQWNWVKGHSGDKYNDEVDQLARTEAIKLQKNFKTFSALLLSNPGPFSLNIFFMTPLSM